MLVLFGDISIERGNLLGAALYNDILHTLAYSSLTAAKVISRASFYAHCLSILKFHLMDTHVYQLLHPSANGNCTIKCRVKAPKYLLINFYCYTTHDIYALYSAANLNKISEIISQLR